MHKRPKRRPPVEEITYRTPRLHPNPRAQRGYPRSLR